MLKQYIDVGTALKDAGVTTNISERVKYTANTGTAVISTANSNIDGSGTIGTVLTAASNGTLVKSITIQARVSTTRGMVRLYVYNPNNNTPYNLIDEIDIPAVIQSATQACFSITYETDFYLIAGLSLAASTQNAEAFVVTADGLDITY